MDYAIVNLKTGVVANRASWDGKSVWAPPDNCVALPDPMGYAQIGFTLENIQDVRSAKAPPDSGEEPLAEPEQKP